MPIQRAIVIGTGMMGPGIAVSLALGGIATTLVSRSREGAAKGLATAHQQMTLLAEHGLANESQASWAQAHLTASDTWQDAAREADLVVESAPEDMAFKQDLFAQLDAATAPHAILASNTSGLSITALAERCQRPERVLTAHFWNPPHLMRLVELVKGERTSDDVVETMRGLLHSCGKVPVVVRKDRPGQLGNRLQHALIREACQIVSEGIASVEDCDLAAMAGFGLRLPAYGIFEHMDAVGLDLVLSIQDYVLPDLNNQPQANTALREKVQQGELGVKSGAGFYNWSEKQWEDVRARRDQFVLSVLKSQGKSTPQE